MGPGALDYTSNYLQPSLTNWSRLQTTPTKRRTDTDWSAQAATLRPFGRLLAASVTMTKLIVRTADLEAGRGERVGTSGGSRHQVRCRCSAIFANRS